jgi:hypothetical protein
MLANFGIGALVAFKSLLGLLSWHAMDAAITLEP